MSFQEQLQTLRKAKGLSQEKLAEFLGISRQAVAKWEMGQSYPVIYQNGQYKYHCVVNGKFNWFQGYEEIYYEEIKVYECFFHGGSIK